MNTLPQPLTEAGIQAIVDEYNRERGYVKGRAMQAAILIVLGFVIALASEGAAVGVMLVLWLLALIPLLSMGRHSTRARDLRLQAKLAADAAGVTIQE